MRGHLRLWSRRKEHLDPYGWDLMVRPTKTNEFKTWNGNRLGNVLWGVWLGRQSSVCRRNFKRVHVFAAVARISTLKWCWSCWSEREKSKISRRGSSKYPWDIVFSLELVREFEIRIQVFVQNHLKKLVAGLIFYCTFRLIHVQLYWTVLYLVFIVFVASWAY